MLKHVFGTLNPDWLWRYAWICVCVFLSWREGGERDRDRERERETGAATGTVTAKCSHQFTCIGSYIPTHFQLFREFLVVVAFDYTVSFFSGCSVGHRFALHRVSVRGPLFR